MSRRYGNWIDLRSKAQKEKDARDFQKKVLPFGEPQRKQILQQLELIQSVKTKDLLLFQFFQIKQLLLEDPDLSIQATLAAANEPYMKKMTYKDRLLFEQILRNDLHFGESEASENP